MMSDLIDLDAVMQPDLRVRLGGVDYRLPGDAPSEVLLRISVLADELAKQSTSANFDPEQLLGVRTELGEAVEELFRIRQPELDSLSLSDTQIAQLMEALFAHYFPKDEEGGDRPTPARTPPKPRSSRPSARSSTASGGRKRTQSRSSTSSPT